MVNEACTVHIHVIMYIDSRIVKLNFDDKKNYQSDQIRLLRGLCLGTTIIMSGLTRG